jgi:hypothetical protein
MPEPTIDGTPIDEIIGTNSDGCYYRLGTGKVTTKDGLKRFTIFVEYRYGDSYDQMSLEEIDVDAIDETDARIIGELAIQRDYEDGGKIKLVEERIGWYL